MNDAPRIDLHTHSTASDGTDSPAELVRKASAAGLDVIAITDHDTTGGWDEALAARPERLTVIRGAEFSTVIEVGGGRTVSVHLLGYLFDPDNAAVRAEQARLRQERLGRGLAIVDRLAADGVGITREQVLTIAGSAPIGRPHIGQALVAAGRVATVTDAFQTYLAGSSKYYVPKADTPIETAVAMIRAAGGVSVVAHGRSRGAARVLTADRFAELAALGLGGVEVDHPDHDARGRSDLRAVAAELGLITTGSSDYHGSNKSIGIGQETTARGQLDAILAAASGVDVVGPLGAVA